MERRLIIDGTAVYEVDEKCLRDKNCGKSEEEIQGNSNDRGGCEKNV